MSEKQKQSPQLQPPREDEGFLGDGRSNKDLSRPPHALPSDLFLEEIEANGDDGLTESQAEERRSLFGVNEWKDEKPTPWWKFIVRQVFNPMALVLIICTVIAFAIRAFVEAVVISIVVCLNILIGSYMEIQAAGKMASLKKLTTPTGNVVRSGHSKVIPSAELVVGDLVTLRSGDKIPADVRLIETVNFEVDESSLTGESLPVAKHGDRVYDNDAANRNAGDRLNVAFSTCNITKGRAKGVVFAVGMKTALGQIAQMSKKPSRIRRPKPKKDGRDPGPKEKLAAACGTVWDAAKEFFGFSDSSTPLQKKLNALALALFFLAIVCFLIVLGANGMKTDKEVVIYGVGTGLSMIPAALPVVLIITMATGAASMKARRVLVRTTKSLEALGGVTNICSDKTGTLTEGAMVVKRAWLPSRGTYDVCNFGDNVANPTRGDLSLAPKQPKDWTDEEEHKQEKGDCGDTKVDIVEEVKHAQVEMYLNVASMANVAVLHQSDKADGGWHARGEPTEIAIQVFAARFDMNRRKIAESEEARWKHVTEFPFDSRVKRMTSIYQTNDGKQWAFTKGATERLLPLCNGICVGDEAVPMEEDSPWRADILGNVEALAKQGLRVLTLATRTEFKKFDPNDRIPVPDTDEEKEARMDRLEGRDDICDCHEVAKDECPFHRDNFEQDLVFRGLIGIYDPPRPESAEAVAMAKKAGIVTHMLTGDHPETAKSIAKQVGILPWNMGMVSAEVARSMVMTGPEMDGLSGEEIDALPVLPLVVARCSPATKVKMVQALHRRGRFCAMTGDGVNDAPALVQADVGIAMGKNGSDVAKESADIILVDDNFRSILNAVEEGRRIFDNIQKFVLHVLAENVGQAAVLLVCLVVKDSLGNSVFPLSPVEIMFVILLTSGLPDMALGQLPGAAGIMDRPPHDNKVGIFTKELYVDLAVIGLWLAALSIAAFFYVLFGGYDGQIGVDCNATLSEGCEPVFRARATCFASLSIFALLLAWQVVDMRRSFFRMKSKPKNPWTQPLKDIWENKLLVGSIIVAIVLLFVSILVPVLNTKIFKHHPLTWEWAVVVVGAVLFFAGVELHKYIKRRYFRAMERKNRTCDSGDIEASAVETDGHFAQYFKTNGVSVDKTDSS
ncbi:hypothetical protein MKZ38_008399 [Zalerion maritima]|uniref:P-type Na(+) transporter n=1 Tax=Zalerion maritima TaxID=339359 RepID=A0AAD5WP54_9PEZI|nr:hypothetical protein MKZ38_008399 [Zalerion maritima]